MLRNCCCVLQPRHASVYRRIASPRLQHRAFSSLFSNGSSKSHHFLCSTAVTDRPEPTATKSRASLLSNHNNGCLGHVRYHSSASDQYAGVMQELWRFVVNCGPTVGAMNVFQFAHESLHLPWCLVSLSAALVIKTLLLPVMVRVHDAQLKQVLMQTVMLQISEQIKAAIQKRSAVRRWGPDEAAKLYQQKLTEARNEIMQKNNCSPFIKGTGNMFNVPFWLFATLALRNLCGANPHYELYLPPCGMDTASLLWIKNLTLPDPYYVLPVVYGCLHVINTWNFILQTRAELKKVATSPASVQRKVTWVRNFAMGGNVVFCTFVFGISFFQPSCVLLFWIASIGSHLLLLRLLKLAVVRRLLRMPDVDEVQLKLVIYDDSGKTSSSSYKTGSVDSSLLGTQKGSATTAAKQRHLPVQEQEKQSSSANEVTIFVKDTLGKL